MKDKFKQIDHYVVSGTFWEHYAIYLINKNRKNIHYFEQSSFITSNHLLQIYRYHSGLKEHL